MSSQNTQTTVVLVSHPGITQNVLHSILKSLAGVTVLGANGALTAYNVLEGQAVDTVIVDANVPLTEKVALVTRIKQNFPHIMCIVLTATSRNHDLLRTVGADRILFQDCSPLEVETAVLSANYNS